VESNGFFIHEARKALNILCFLTHGESQDRRLCWRPLRSGGERDVEMACVTKLKANPVEGHSRSAQGTSTCAAKPTKLTKWPVQILRVLEKQRPDIKFDFQEHLLGGVSMLPQRPSDNPPPPNWQLFPGFNRRHRVPTNRWSPHSGQKRRCRHTRGHRRAEMGHGQSPPRTRPPQAPQRNEHLR